MASAQDTETTASSTVVLSKQRRGLVASAWLAIVLATGVGVTEAVVSASFISLREWLGFWAGWGASVVAWALAGIAALFVVDVVWPRIDGALHSILSRAEAAANPLLDRAHRLPASAGVAVACALAVAGGVIAYAVGGTPTGWVARHYALVSLICAVTLVLFLFLAAYEALGALLERLVRYVPTIARDEVRLAAKCGAGLAVMIYVGPVLTRPMLRPLGVTQRSWQYALTLAAAPCFGVWYPVYTLGIADNVQRVFS